MNITHIYGSANRMHGATKWLLLFSSLLAKQNNNSTIVCLNFNIPLPHWFKGEIRPLWKNNFLSHEFSGIKKLLFITIQFIAMPLLVFKIPQQTEVIIYHGDHSIFTSFLSKIFHRHATHIYYCYQSPRELYDLATTTKQTYGIWYFLLWPLLSFYKKIDRFLVRRMSTILVWSKEHRELIRPIYGDLNYHSIPAAVDFSVYNKDSSIINRVNLIKNNINLDDKKVLLMNASLTAKKRIPMFLDLIKKLTMHGYNVQAMIIGEGPDEHKLKSLSSSLNIESHVTFLKYVSQKDIPVYYHLCDLLIYLEPRGLWTMSIIEAGASRKPVITAPGGSMPTLVNHEHTGYVLSDINETDDLFKKTATLLDNDILREQMGENNYTHCLQFSVEEAANNFLKAMPSKSL